MVLLHGFGAPGDDLVPLVKMLSLPAGVRCAFPIAPLELPAFWGESRAWWMIDTAQLQAAIASGRQVDISNQSPPGMLEARTKLVATLRALRAELGGEDSPLIIGGFSQGAMLSCDVALRTELPVSGLVLLSGTLVCAREWRAGALKRAGLPVFQSHGRSDPLLSFAAAEQLRELLTEAGLAATWHPFDGAHQIPPQVLEALSGFLRRQLGG
ncbi:MAG: esterase [Haliangiales bacterium]